MRWYIAGPMTGYPQWNYPAFHAAAAMLRAEGLEVVNPAELIPDTTVARAECLKVDIAALIQCQGIALLPGWQDSRGARLESHIAEELGLARRLLEPAADLPPLPFIPEDPQQRLRLIAWGQECRRPTLKP